ncbi:thiamine pyrophosphate-binding protein [Mesorhizobium sp. CU2]|uniref:thiamine pyrophosphate-binding protein n=1 Tax=unclassified Mesorhizobium TaxID=325217 RepID=UPI001129FEB2|nr:MULTISPECIES: thiamine pyrophosphate-binding protein [unclassified Mesorhizobium]TPN81080.1 thiamine pyrophosphate-binding protein [Mesorhizobium sp. CU3]TPO11698.1 thiamine pyrophosphate-binding protein [Mesorhizobium sp. CU2]
MSSVTAGEWLARTLGRQGIDHVFFVDAILRRTLVELEQVGVKRVLAHTEKAAAYMADGYARIRGLPGICMAQSVGAANLAAGLQDAFLAQSPVIALTGRKPLSYRDRNAYQEVKHAPLFSSVSKFSGDVDDPRELPRMLAHAWRVALTATPGPTHLDIDGLTGDRLERGLVGDATDWAVPLGAGPVHRALANETELATAAEILLGAKRLAIVAGSGATLSQAGSQLLTLAERLAAPIATSLGARGIVPTRHRLAVGTVGNYSAAPANQVVHAADVVLFVGCRAGDQVTLDWQVPGAEVRIVQLDADPVEIGRNYANTSGICGDPKLALEALIGLTGNPDRDSAYSDWAAGLMQQWRADLARLVAEDIPAIRVERLCHEIGEALPANGILVADTGYSSIWSCTCIELNGAGQTYLRAAGSLGWSFPAAMGAKCAAGDRPVICLTGDGGFYYHLAELETARRNDIAVVVVVNNNSGFGQSLSSIRAIQGQTPGKPEELYQFGPLDFARVAESFGVRGIRVEKAADIAGALREAIALKAPVVLDVVTDIGPRTPSPWKPA